MKSTGTKKPLVILADQGAFVLFNPNQGLEL